MDKDNNSTPPPQDTAKVSKPPIQPRKRPMYANLSGAGPRKTGFQKADMLKKMMGNNAGRQYFDSADWAQGNQNSSGRPNPLKVRRVQPSNPKIVSPRSRIAQESNSPKPEGSETEDKTPAEKSE